MSKVVCELRMVQVEAVIRMFSMTSFGTGVSENSRTDLRKSAHSKKDLDLSIISCFRVCFPCVRDKKDVFDRTYHIILA